HRARWRKCCLKFCDNLTPGTLCSKITLPITLRVREQIVRCWVQKPDRAQERRHSTGSVCATTKAKEKDFVTRFIVCDKKSICIRDVVEKAVPINKSRQHRQPFCQFRLSPWFRHCANARIVVSELSRVPTGYLVGANDVGVIAIELVIRSIAAHHESFCHKSGSYSNMSNSPRDCVSGHRIEQAISYVLEPIARCQQNCQQTALKKSARAQADADPQIHPQTQDIRSHEQSCSGLMR